MFPSSDSRFSAYSFLEKKNEPIIDEKIVKSRELFNLL